MRTGPTSFFGRSRVDERHVMLSRLLAVCSLLVPTILYEVLVRVWPEVPVGPFLLPLAVLIIVGAVPTRIDVRSNGVLVSWFGSRLYAYRDIVDVRRSNSDLVLLLASGKRVPLPLRLRSPRIAARPHAERDALFLAIREHLDVARQGRTETAA